MPDSDPLELHLPLGEAASTSGSASWIPPLLMAHPALVSPDRYDVAMQTLYEACNSGNFSLVQSVFAEFLEGLDIDESISRRLQADLIFAAAKGYADIVSCLLDHGIDMTDSAT